MSHSTNVVSCEQSLPHIYPNIQSMDSSTTDHSWPFQIRGAVPSLSPRGRGYDSRRWLQDTSKRKLADVFIIFTPPPLPVSSGSPEADPMTDQNRRSELKKSGWLKLLAGFTRKKASTRRVNKKIADSTRNKSFLFKVSCSQLRFCHIPTAGFLQPKSGWP